MLSQKTNEILSHFSLENPGVRKNIATLLEHGCLKGTGKMVILAVDQGFEHGPMRSFLMNDPAHDPAYHFQMAEKGQLSGLAAPLGFLEAGLGERITDLPLILKMNSANSLFKPEDPHQSITATIDDALRLGCVGVGFTIYPSSNATLDQFEQLRDLIAEAKANGLATIVWSYPRGNVSKAGETALDVIAYGTHMAALLGAHIIKVKTPTSAIETKEAKSLITEQGLDFSALKDRIAYVKKAALADRRLVIFSGGTTVGDGEILASTQAIKQGGGDGSIIGRNIFQRTEAEALTLMHNICAIYQGE